MNRVLVRVRELKTIKGCILFKTSVVPQKGIGIRQGCGNTESELSIGLKMNPLVKSWNQEFQGCTPIPKLSGSGPETLGFGFRGWFWGSGFWSGFGFWFLALGFGFRRKDGRRCDDDLTFSDSLGASTKGRNKVTPPNQFNSLPHFDTPHEQARIPLPPLLAAVPLLL